MSLPAPSKVAVVFPGQGSDSVGMGRDLYEQSSAARDVFNEVDQELSRPLSRLIFDGPSEDLRRTDNAQPAITTVSLACIRALEQEQGHPIVMSMVAGHSLGEYTALAASGVLSVADTVRLVVERGRFMQEACKQSPGGMVAVIGLDEFVLEDICRQIGTYVANINGSGQIVISGDHLRLAKAIDLATIRGARRCIPLKVSGAFHSELMTPARSGLARVIDSLEFRDPAVPIIGNVMARPLTTGSEIKAELVTQLLSCVQWEKTVGFMMNNGVDRFVEVGPGRLLANLIRRIEPDANVFNVNDMTSVQSFAA